MFLPIIANIAVLTTSVGFKGTWLLTILMSFAATWLVAWDYDRLKPVFFAKRTQKAQGVPRAFILLPLVFGLGGVAMALLFWLGRVGNLNNYVSVGGIMAGMGLVFGLIVAVHLEFMKVGELEP